MSFSNSPWRTKHATYICLPRIVTGHRPASVLHVAPNGERKYADPNKASMAKCGLAAAEKSTTGMQMPRSCALQC